MSDETREQDHGQEKGGNKKLVIVCVVAVLIIAVLVAVIFYLMKNGKEATEPEETPERPVVVTEDNIEEILNPTDPPNIPMSYDVMMSDSVWEFADGKSASDNAYVVNSEDNETAVYFDVIRNDTQETIYQSPVIPLGGNLDNIVLDKELDAGDYECTMVYHLIDDNQNTLTTLNVRLVIKIAN